MIVRFLVVLFFAAVASADVQRMRATPQGTGPCGTTVKNAVERGQQVRFTKKNLTGSTPVVITLGNDNSEVELGSFETDSTGQLDVEATMPMTFPIPNAVVATAQIGVTLLISDPLFIMNASQCDLGWAAAQECNDADFDGICNAVDDCPDLPGPCPTGPACSDGADNDHDGRVDFGIDPILNDPGCTSAVDTDEKEGSRQCDDGIDNDNDGLRDFAVVLSDFGPPIGVQVVRSDTSDPACLSPSSPKEGTQCDDSIDNDGDTFVDFDGQLGTMAKDPECRAAWWDDESTVPEPGRTASALVAALSLAWVSRCRARLSEPGLGP